MRGALTSPRASPVAAGLAIVAGLAVAGCGQVPSLVGAATPPANPNASSSPSAVRGSHPIAPLTGLPAASPADAARPAVALDVAGPHPSGLTAADLVFEEVTSPVRYIAVYQSRDASGVGPITTTQPTDRMVLTVLHPLIGYDGAAAPYFVKFLDKTTITDVSFTGHPTLYASGAAGPTTSTQAILRAARHVAPPQPLFSYRGVGAAGGTLAGKEFRCTSVSVALPGLGTQDWTFDQHADRWVLTRNGPKVAVANLVVQMVPYKQVNVSRRQGIVVSTAEVTGSGKAEVFSGSISSGSGGTGAIGTWSKPHVAELTNYFDSSMAPMAFQSGPTWVILAPLATHVSTSGA
jgi:Protein of unknown function (DUF3048) C-terminal domain/Protein of unknown function (DUF3048) N-terminal domain